MPVIQKRSVEAAARHHHTQRLVAHVPEVPVRVGARFEVALDVACEQGCGLLPTQVTILSPDGSSATCEVMSTDSSSTGITELAAPLAPGTYTWTFEFPECTDGAVHARCSFALRVEIVPHTASLAVWALPDSVIAGQSFKLKAGASSTAGAVLAGQPIEIRDATGELAGRGILGGQPWPGTAALLWADIDVTTPGFSLPSTGGIASWTAHLPTDGIAPAHDAIASSFTLAVSAAPKHRLEVSVIDKTTGAAIGDAVVRLGTHRAATDAAGRADLMLADGVFDLVIWKAGYDVPAIAIAAGSVEAVLVEATATGEEDPDARWTA